MQPTWYLASNLAVLALVGLGAASVAFMQWRTAHLRVVLDLFDKRMAILRAAEEVFAEIHEDGAVDRDHQLRMIRTIYDGQFLFGEDVAIFLSGKLEILSRIRTVSRRVADTRLSEERRADLLEEEEELYGQLQRFVTELRTVAAKYVRLHTTVIPTPKEYFSALNARRKAVGD